MAISPSRERGGDFVSPLNILIHDYAGHPFPTQLSRELARRGHTVTHAYAGGLLTPRGALLRRADDPAGLTFLDVPMSPAYRENKYSFLKRLGYERDYGLALARLVGKMKPDLVLSGQTPSEPQLRMTRAAEAAGIPVVTWVQDFYSLAVAKLARRKYPVIGAMAGIWYRWLDRQCLRASVSVVAITEDFIPMLTDFGVPASRVTVVPNWAPLEELPLCPKVNPWAVRHQLAERFVFLYSGTLAMKHNPDLLRALAAEFRDDPEVRIVVISEGPGADYLARCKAVESLDNLVLLDFQPFADMPEVLATADVQVAVLEADAGVFSVPSKVLTYLSARRAILGAIPAENLAARIITQQAAGRCVAPDDVVGFVQAARALWADAPARERAAGNGRAYAEREFDIKRITTRFEELFVRVVKISERRA